MEIKNYNQIILAEKIQYEKLSNIVNAKGKVVINDTLKNYEIKAEDISYFKNQNKIITKGKTKAKIEKYYKVDSEDVLYLINKKILSSQKKTQIISQRNQILVEKLQLLKVIVQNFP